MQGITLLVVNGKIHTMNPKQPVVEALAATDERIVALGSSDELRRLAGPETKVVDLGGRTATPGFTDAHIHFVSWSLGLNQIKLDDVPSLVAAVQAIREGMATRQDSPESWVRGRGWLKNQWPEDRFPTCHDLDAVIPDRPAVFSSRDGHSIWVNSRALKIAGITRDMPDPEGGHIMRDEHGEPAGMLFENAEDLVYKHIPEPTDEECLAAIREGTRVLQGMGITGIHLKEYDQSTRVLQKARERGELGLRCLISIPRWNLEKAIGTGLRSGFGDEWIRMGAVKLFSDGALGSQTAHMLEPYAGGDNLGIPTLTPEQLRHYVLAANSAGIACAIHAIGDAANRIVLDAFAAAQQAGVNVDAAGRPLRNRIEHAQILHPDDLRRFAALNVIASMQPIHCTNDRDTAARYWGERCRYSYAWRSIIESGAHIAFGSDAPVETPDVLQGIYAAVTRRRPHDPTPGWYPEECLTVEEAVAAYTSGAAYAGGLEQDAGTLEAGKLADLTVLSHDIFTGEPKVLLETAIDYTILGGQVVFERSRKSKV